MLKFNDLRRYSKTIQSEENSFQVLRHRKMEEQANCGESYVHKTIMGLCSTFLNPIYGKL